MFEMRAKMILGLLGAAVMLPVNLAEADQLGHASWYSLPANKTANGEQMNPNELTAAHRSLPFGTRVLVENLANGKSVVVRINDRGPFIGGRIIDLSKGAAASIGMIHSGTAKVRVTTTTSENAVAALGEATAKAKAGAALAASAKVDVAALEPAPKTVTAALKSSGGNKRVAAKVSPRVKPIAKKRDTQAKVRAASASKSSRSAKTRSSNVRTASYTKGIHAAAKQASRFTGRRTIVADAHPYAILGTTPGFMKPTATKTRRTG